MRRQIMGSLMGDPYDSSWADQYFAQMAQEKKRRSDAFAKNVELSFDEEALSNEVAKMFAGQLPAGTKLEKAKHPTMFAAVQDAFGKDDPRRRAMAEIKKNYAEFLRTPEFSGLTKEGRVNWDAGVMGPGQLLHIAQEATLDGTPSEKVKGQSLRDDVYRYFYRRADSGLFPDKRLMPAPGYEEWVAEQRAKPIEERDIGFAAGAAYTAGGSAAMHLTGRALTGIGVRGAAAGVAKFLTAQPILPGKLAGLAIYGGLAVTAGDALNNAIRKTDWYRSREDMPVARDVLALAPEIALDVMAGWPLARKAAQAVVVKAVERGVVSDGIVKAFHSKPSAEHIIELGKARRLEKVYLDKLQERLVSPAVDKFEKAALFKHLDELGRNPAETFAARPTTEGWRKLWHTEPTGVEGVIRRDAAYAYNYLDEMLARRPNVPAIRPGGDIVPVPGQIKNLGTVRPVGADSLPGSVVPRISPARNLLELPAGVNEANLPVVYAKTSDIQKAFTQLSPEDVIAVTDRVVGGQPVAAAVADIRMNNALAKAIENTESAIRSQQPKALPVGTYDGAEAIVGTPKAAKVAQLQREVSEGPKGTAIKARKAAGDAAITKAAKEKKKPGRKEKTERFDVVGGVEQPPRLMAVLKNEMDSASYIDEMTSQLARMVEEERIVEQLVRDGVPRESARQHRVFQRWWKEYAQPAIQREEAEIRTVANVLDNESIFRPLTGAERAAMKATIEAERAARGPAAPTYGSIPNDWVKTLRGLGFVGGTVGMLTLADMFGSVEEAEAAIGPMAKTIAGAPKAWFKSFAEYAALKAMPKAEIHARHAQLLKDADAAGWTARPVGDSKVIPRRMETPDFATYAANIYGNVRNAIWREGKLPFGLERIFGAAGRGDMHYRPGANPAVHMAAMQTTWANNTDAAYTVLENIMRDVAGGKTATRAITERMRPLAQNYQEVVGAWSTLKTKLDQLQKADDFLTTKVITDRKLKPEARAKLEEKIANNRAKMEKLQGAFKEVDPQYQQYLKEWEVAAREIAQQHPAARVFFAAEDTVDGQYYPWLQGMLTGEEKKAATYIKSMMKSYEEAAVAAKLNVITDRPFMHYGWHPDWKADAGKKWLEARQLHDIIPTVPYNNFHHRLVGARPMVPDVWHSVHSYIPIAERTIGWKKFWDDGGKHSWRNHMRSTTVQNNEALRTFWNSIMDASKPVQRTEVDKWLERYFNFEVFRLLGFSPSVAYKHFFKNIGTWAALGFGEAASHMGPAAAAAIRIKMNSPEMRQRFIKLGMNPKMLNKKFYDDAAASYTKQGKMINILDHMELRPGTQLGWFDNFMEQVNRKAGFQTAAVESYDRVHSFLAASEMAAKRGLTATDATYGIYDTILTNNFLGGIVNPSWAKSSKVRALLLFQTTAWKILERRIVTGMRSGKAIQEVFSSLKKDTQGWTWDRVASEMDSLRRFIISGEYEFKRGMITDALATQRDFMGQFSVRQAMREMIYAGMVIGGGAAIGHDYKHHVHHAPFLSGLHDEPTIGLSPIAKAAHRTYADKPYGGEHSEFGIVGDFLKNWFQGNAPIPQMISKSLNIQAGDIPDRYKEEGFLPKEFRYLWAIPSPKEKEPRKILPDSEAFW